jgi:large subunit ribosomal protein L22
MEARAIARHIRVSPRKVRQVLALIDGKGVNEAQDLLRFTNRPIARQVSKVLKSAVSNAVDREDEVEVDELVVCQATADPGPILKRWLPRARRRATPILKRTCHITIVVGDEK